MNYEETMAYIHATDWRGSRPGLSRIAALCRALGDPQKKLRCLHVAGTNGKGSVSAMLDAVLRRAGYRVGLFTSPYIYRFEERIRLDGEPISEEDLCAVMDKVRPLADAMEDRPTEFELISAAAFLYYAEKAPDFVVLEVGMGGRLDATNVIEDPLLCLVTGIALDHTKILGDTEEKIAAEKAGIFKPSSRAAAGEVSPAVAAVLSERAAACGIPITFTAPEKIRVKEAGRDGIVFDYKERQNVRLPFAALYQPKNASLVLDAIDILKEAGVVIPEEAVRGGLAGVSWAGRFEFFRRDPDVIFDGSHNPQGIAAAAESIAALYPGKVLLLTGVMADKDYAGMIRTLSSRITSVFAVRPDNPRALPAEDLAAVWQKAGVPAHPFPDVESAMRMALQTAKEKRLPLFILGSLYLYREAKDAFIAVNR